MAEHNVALIGCGYWGKNYAHTLSGLKDVNLRFIADPLGPKLRLASQPVFVKDYRVALQDKGIDSVVVATPTETHYNIAREAIISGKNVLVEKPITYQPEFAGRLTQLANETGKVLMVGHIFMYNPAVQRLKKIVDQGELGKILFMNARRLSLGPIRQSENVMWDLAPHDLSMFTYLSNVRPVSVSAIGAAFYNCLEDAVSLSLRFEDKSFATLAVSWINPLKIRDLVVVGDKKMCLFDDTAVNKLQIYDKGVSRSQGDPTDYAITYREGDVLLPKISSESPLGLQCKHFFECVETGKRPLSDGRNGELVVKILDAAQRSLKAKGVEIEIE